MTPAAPSRLARALDRASLPVPLALGVKDLLARRHRALRLAGAITVTGAAIVFALSMQATLDARPAGEASDVPDELPALVYTLDAVLLRDHGDDAGRRRPAVRARACPRLRRAEGDRPHAGADRLEPGQRPRRRRGDRGAGLDPVGIGLYFVVFALAGGDSETS